MLIPQTPRKASAILNYHFSPEGNGTKTLLSFERSDPTKYDTRLAQSITYTKVVSDKTVKV